MDLGAKADSQAILNAELGQEARDARCPIRSPEDIELDVVVSLAALIALGAALSNEPALFG